MPENADAAPDDHSIRTAPPSGTRIIVGDALTALRGLPSESVHCVMTSPPYWRMRAYRGEPGMIGMEDTLSEHIERLIEVFREVMRVMRPEATLWVNYGDGYAGSGHAARDPGKIAANFSPKNLMMLPARVAIALQDDGWLLRHDVIWHKTNPNPGSATDRPVSAHEHLFLFAKQPKYFYDAAAVTVEGSPNTHARRKDRQRLPRKGSDAYDNRGGSWTDHRSVEEQAAIGTNLRDVWPIGTRGYPDAHFATFPESLCEPPIKAGTPEGGVCSACGTPRRRIYERTGAWHVREPAHVPENTPSKVDSTGWSNAVAPTDEWVDGCRCEAERSAATVLDPFGGAGTLAVVANRLNRNAVLVEISPEYARMAKDRIEGDAPLFSSVSIEP